LTLEEEGEIKDNFKENVKPESRGLDDELVLLMSRKRHKKPKHNLKFLTVEDTQYKGSFSGKFREDPSSSITSGVRSRSLSLPLNHLT
jgi:hypothetical protein